MKDYSTVSVRLTSEEKEKLVEYCKENDLSISQVIRRAIREFLENK